MRASSRALDANRITLPSLTIKSIGVRTVAYFVAGSLGYTLSAFFTYLFPSAELVSQLLTVPSIVGEVWITGYLIIFGIRRHTSAHDQVMVSSPHPRAGLRMGSSDRRGRS